MRAIAILLLAVTAFIGGCEYHRQQSPCTFTRAAWEKLLPGGDSQ